MKQAAREKITATFQFNRHGDPVQIFLNASSEADQRILEAGLERLFKREKIGLLRRIFRGRGRR
jgi:hypothetical protein